MPYAFRAKYNNQIGIFIADDYEAGRTLAWESLKVMLPDPDPALFTITPMSQADIDTWDGPPISSMEPFEPWAGPSLDELRQELEVSNRLLADYDQIMAEIPACPEHGRCLSYALDWIRTKIIADLSPDEQYYKGYTTAITDSVEAINQIKSRPMANMESEAFSSIANLQNELHEAKKIIRALLGAPPPGIWRKWPVAYRKATTFLEEKPYRITADGDD